MWTMNLFRSEGTITTVSRAALFDIRGPNLDTLSAS